MKNLLLVVLTFFTLNAVAQEQKTKRPNRKTGLEMMKQMTPSERADLQAKKLSLNLDLSDAQQENVHDIILKQAKTNESFRQARRTSANADKAKRSADKVLKMRNDRLDQQIQMKREMKVILTPEQYEKFEKIEFMKQNKRKKQRGKCQKQQ